MVKDKIKLGFGRLMKKMHKATVEEKKKAAEAKDKADKDEAHAKKTKDAEAKKKDQCYFWNYCNFGCCNIWKKWQQIYRGDFFV